MAVPSDSAPRGAATAPVAEAQRLWDAARSLEAQRPRTSYVEALKAYLAYVETHRRAFETDGREFAERLDETAMSLYRLSEPDLAVRAVDLGLGYGPDLPSLLHHKALFLLTQNRNVDEALALLDKALVANPHDKAIWAGKGDALRLLSRPNEAVEAYLHAQQLDATSIQYVERALKLMPQHPGALRVKLQLAKAHGGDAKALEACDALLAVSPDDGELLLARAELLRSLGRLPEAVEALDRAESHRPAGDPRLALLRGRILMALGRSEDALTQFATLIRSEAEVDVAALREIADAIESQNGDVKLAVATRQRWQRIDPRNVENLTALRNLASRANDAELGTSVCRAILEISPGNLQALRALAEFQLASGKTDEAFETFRTLLRDHPNDAAADAARALEAARAANRTDVVTEFGRAHLQANPNDSATLEGLVQSHLAQGDLTEALAAINQLVRIHPNDLALLERKKSILIDLNRPDELPAVYDELFRLDPTRTDVAIERGDIYLRQALDAARGSSERETAARAALVSFERSSLEAELTDRSLLGIAQASRLLGNNDRTIQAFRDFLARTGNDRRGEVWKELGHALREADLLVEAEQAYDQAIQLGREDTDLYWGAATALAALNREEQALRLLELLLQHEPQNPLYLRRKGQLLLTLDHRTEGLAALRQAVAGAHGDPHVHFEVAQALRAHGAYQDAVTYYRQGLQLNPKDQEGRLGLAETLQLNGQYTEVVPIVDGLLKEDANDLPAWQCRADAYRALGRTPEVLYSLKAVLLLDPHNAIALLEKFRLHSQLGQKSEAFEALDQLIRLGAGEGNDPALLLQHGDLAANLGKVEEANRSYERAAQLDPTQLSEIAARRARVRLAAGRPDLALEILDSTLAGAPEATARSLGVLLLRAEILMALERPSEAHQVFEEVRNREPKSPVAIAGIARSLLDQGSHEDAKNFLIASIPVASAAPVLYLMLAEAHSGLGSIPEAIAALQRGTELLPKSPELWARLAELHIAREGWPEASNALAHAIALEASNADLLLRAGFVAERLTHPNEALALYEHATQVAPSNKAAWTSRGVALLATGRPEEATQSFERALALDSDYEPAKDGKRTAQQRTRDSQIGKVGREALLLEARLRRAVTKNDLFVTLHVPYDMLDPVLNALTEAPPVEIDRLSESELKELETASYRLIIAALENRPEGIERRGFTLGDVAVLSSPNYSLAQIQRLFGYLKAVLETDLRAENLQLTPDVEELVRRAMTMIPNEQRTLFQIVRTLKVGIFKARIVKVVEGAGSAVHAPLPTLDLGSLGPEFQVTPAEDPVIPQVTVAPISAPVASVAPASHRSQVPAAAPFHGPSKSESSHGITRTRLGPEVGTHTVGQARCVGCGGLASVTHECGAPLCHHCIAQFHTCPKCRVMVTPESTHSLTSGHGRIPPTTATSAEGFSVQSVVAKARIPKTDAPATRPARSGEHPRSPEHAKPAEPHKAPEHPAVPPAPRPSEHRHAAPSAEHRHPAPTTEHHHPVALPAPAASNPPATAPAPAPAPEPKPVQKPHRERPDDEPRL